jgi:hypothetical protein
VYRDLDHRQSPDNRGRASAIEARPVWTVPTGICRQDGAGLLRRTHIATTGLAKKSDCRSAIVVVSAAEQLLSSEIIPIPKYISELRRSCQQSLPNKAFLGAFQ